MSPEPLCLEDPFFLECLSAAIHTPGFVQEFDRLTGHNLSLRGTGLDLKIDEATGRLEQGMVEFVKFVKETIYDRLENPNAATP